MFHQHKTKVFLGKIIEADHMELSKMTYQWF